jgi:hypothetical protein
MKMNLVLLPAALLVACSLTSCEIYDYPVAYGTSRCYSGSHYARPVLSVTSFNTRSCYSGYSARGYSPPVTFSSRPSYNSYSPPVRSHHSSSSGVAFSDGGHSGHGSHSSGGSSGSWGHSSGRGSGGFSHGGSSHGTSSGGHHSGHHRHWIPSFPVLPR